MLRTLTSLHQGKKSLYGRQMDLNLNPYPGKPVLKALCFVYKAHIMLSALKFAHPQLLAPLETFTSTL